MILKYILNKIRYPVKKNNLDKTVKNKNNRWLYMVYLHNDTYQVQVDCDGMSNECHVILLYFLSGLRFKAATYIKMLGNCGQALDSGDVSVKAVHFSSNKYNIIQFHFLLGLRFKATTYIKMLGNCYQALDWGVVSYIFQ